MTSPRAGPVFSRRSRRPLFSRFQLGGALKYGTYLFAVGSMTWSRMQKLTASDPEANDEFGTAVSVSGDIALIGAIQRFGGKGGKAYIFTFDVATTTWSQLQKLTASDPAEGDLFGFSVSVSGDTALIGASQERSRSGSIGSGKAYIFTTFDGSAWTQLQKLTAEDAAVDDNFGASVSVNSDKALIGALGDDNDAGMDAGAVSLFIKHGSTWSQQQKLIARDAADGDEFGTAVSVSGYNAIVGAPAKDDNDAGRFAGSAYMFDF